jgi:hypothetical protein
LRDFEYVLGKIPGLQPKIDIDLSIDLVSIFAITSWGGIFELRIDHCGLKHLFGQPTLNARQTRWRK